MKLLATLVVPLVTARVVRFEPQIPLLQTQVSGENVAPGIGVHFTASHATVAARYDNGTTWDLVRIDADADYVELMSTWANSPKSDCHGSRTRLSSALQRAVRSSRKALGLPASRNAGILGSFLKQIRGAVEDELKIPMSTIAPAFATLNGFEDEAFHDALEFAGLTSTKPTNGADSFVYRETNAAYAGHGYGLCESWRNSKECADEEKHMRHEHVLFLNFDSSFFSATVQYMQNAYNEHAYSNTNDMSLGWWNLPVDDVPRARFWARMHEELIKTVGAVQHPPNKIVLLGEHAGDAEFIEVVKTAMWEILEIDVSLMLSAHVAEGVGRLAARGAAEFARRSEVWRREDTPLQALEGIEL